MHVLLIHQAFASPNEAGGTRHFELARHLVQQGHCFTIVASDRSYLTGKTTVAATRLVSEEVVDGVRILRAYTYPSLHRSFVGRIISFLSFMLTSVWAAWRAGPVDIVMGTTPPIFQAISAWLMAVARRRPFLLEVRDLWPEFAIGLGVLRNPMLIAASRWLERFLYARATHLLVNSPAYGDYLIEHKVAPCRISLIPNGVDPAQFHPDWNGEQVRAELGLNGLFVVTYAGALGLANDIPTILKAAEYLRAESGIRFLLVGDGKERASLETQSRQLGLTNVTFAGSRPKSEMAAILAGSNACLAILKDIPMFRTTYPNKVFDYMAAGRPTVLAIDGVIRQAVEAAEGGVFVPPGDAQALAAAVLALSRDPERARRMGQAARQYVTTHFNRQQQAQDFNVLIQQLAERGA